MLADGPTLPDECDQLWADFLELHLDRGSTGFGPLRITLRDVEAWQRIRCTVLPQWQIDAIRKADEAYMRDWADRQPKADK